MTKDQVFLWLLILAAGIAFDVAAYQWVRRLRQRNLTPLMLVERAVRPLLLRAQQWWASRPRPAARPKPVLPVPASPPVSEERVRPSEPEPSAPLTMDDDRPPTEELPAPEALPVTTTLTPALAEAAPRLVHVQFSADLPEGASLRVTIETTPGAGATTTSTVQTFSQRAPVTARAAPRSALPLRWPTVGGGLGQRLAQLWARWRLQGLAAGALWFSAALLVYAFTHLIGLTRYPIYFFTDEAIHMNLVADFVRDGFKNYQGEFFPTYFHVGLWLNSVSVYVQLIPFLLFGKSVFVTRAASALITLLGAAAVGLILKDIFKVRHSWLGVLLLSIAPAWFLHSRTAFEYIELGSFYAGFLYFYLRYRAGSPRALYAAVAAGALVFYTHGLGQALMGISAVLLFISDAPYHLARERRGVVLRAAGLALLLLVPFIRFNLQHQDIVFENMRTRNSYWTDINLSFTAKLTNFVNEYLYSLSPAYWFLPNTRDLVRHTMKGYGNLWWPTFPFLAWGLWQCLKQWRSSAHRAVLLALLAAPLPSTLVAVGMPRMVWVTIPAVLLTALGVAAVADWLEARGPQWRRGVGPALFAALAGFNGYMLWDALTNGPVWYTDYGLYGMQFGAQQVFAEAIPPRLAQNPDLRIIISPSWANGTDQFVNFFLTPEQSARVRMGSVEEFTYNPQVLNDNMLFVLPYNDYDRAVADPKFKSVSVDDIIPYPDGRPGFYLVRLAYADNVEALFAAERAARRQPIAEAFTLHGRTVTVTHSLFGAGLVEHIFDGDLFTVIRGAEANPLLVQVDYPTPLPNPGLITFTVGSMTDFSLTATLYAPGASEPVSYTQRYRGYPDDPTAVLTLGPQPAQITRVALEIKDNNAGDVSAVHVREIELP